MRNANVTNVVVVCCSCLLLFVVVDVVVLFVVGSRAAGHEKKKVRGPPHWPLLLCEVLNRGRELPDTKGRSRRAAAWPTFRESGSTRPKAWDHFHTSHLFLF